MYLRFHPTTTMVHRVGVRAASSIESVRAGAHSTASDARWRSSYDMLDVWRGTDEGRDGLVWCPKEGPVCHSSCSPEIRGVYDALRGRETDVSDVREASLEEYGLRVLCSAHPLLKAELTHKAWREYASGKIRLFAADEEGARAPGAALPSALPSSPARPAKPELVPAREIPSLKSSRMSPSAYTLHNLAHVELNAIDLAWDSMVRFSHLRLPHAFYEDFVRVADDESRHLGWCLQRLYEVGARYGDMPAHNLLWDGCIASSNDVRERLAVVPMSQEARGLDAGGRLAERLVGWGDNVSAAIVTRISEEERQHVAVGTYWFGAICGALEQDAQSVFVDTLTTLTPELLRPPFNNEAREAVGLPRSYYDENLWSESDRRRLSHIRTERKKANPMASGMADDPGLRGQTLPPIDAAALRVRLSSFLQFEDEM